METNCAPESMEGLAEDVPGAAHHYLHGPSARSWDTLFKVEGLP